MRANLKEARRRAGMTQQQMADRLEISINYYQKIEATNQEIRELIKRMVDTIEDNKKLQQIFNYIHRIYIRRAGK